MAAFVSAIKDKNLSYSDRSALYMFMFFVGSYLQLHWSRASPGVPIKTRPSHHGGSALVRAQDTMVCQLGLRRPLGPTAGQARGQKVHARTPNTSKFDLRRLTCDVWICAANMIITTTTMLLRLYRHTRSTCCHSICS